MEGEITWWQVEALHVNPYRFSSATKVAVAEELLPNTSGLELRQLIEWHHRAAPCSFIQLFLNPVQKGVFTPARKVPLIPCCNEPWREKPSRVRLFKRGIRSAKSSVLRVRNAPLPSSPTCVPCLASRASCPLDFTRAACPVASLRICGLHPPPPPSAGLQSFESSPSALPKRIWPECLFPSPPPSRRRRGRLPLEASCPPFPFPTQPRSEAGTWCQGRCDP